MRPSTMCSRIYRMAEPTEEACNSASTYTKLILLTPVTDASFLEYVEASRRMHRNRPRGSGGQGHQDRLEFVQ